MDPGKHGHARNVIPGIPPSRNRIVDVTSGPPIPCAALGVPCLPDTSPAPAVTTVMYREGGGDMNPGEPTSTHFYLDALVWFPSIYVHGDMVSVQVLLQEGVYLRERKAEPWKRLLRPSTGR